MRVYGSLFGSLSQVPTLAKAVESTGYDAGVSAEVANDPFFPLILAAEHTETIDLMTSIAVAFARNPMTLAGLGYDLNGYSRGRFILGLGSQIKPHITKRFSMPWSHPAPRMRELILAMRAIWDCWQDGKPLNFRGEFYSHSLMTPMFTPSKSSYGPPRVALAAVGPLMTEVAGEAADGIIAHGFTTRRYLAEVTLPAIERGLSKGGRSRSDFEIICPVFVASGADPAAFEASCRTVCQQIAFYGSTPAYRPVLELHGWGGLQSELNALSKQGKWTEMGRLIGEEILEEFAIVAEPDRVADVLKERFGGLIDTWICTFETGDPDRQQELVRAIQS